MSVEFRERVNRVEALVGALEKCPDATAREASRELVRTLLDLHAAGLEKMLELVESETALIDRFADDELISSLLLLHGLHPQSAAERVSRALERGRSRLRALGGDVELIEATDNIVRLRLRGERSPALRAATEEVVIGAAPDALLEFEEVSDPFLGGRVSLPLVAQAGSRP